MKKFIALCLAVVLSLVNLPELFARGGGGHGGGGHGGGGHGGGGYHAAAHRGGAHRGGAHRGGRGHRGTYHHGGHNWNYHHGAWGFGWRGFWWGWPAALGTLALWSAATSSWIPASQVTNIEVPVVTEAPPIEQWSAEDESYSEYED